MKKILSFFLALALCLTVLPSSYLDVYAAEEDPQPSEEIYEVYNGFGELEFTASSIEEVEEQVNYSATSYRASCFTHYCISCDVTQLNVLRNVHRRISLGYSIPTVYVLFMLLH